MAKPGLAYASITLVLAVAGCTATVSSFVVPAQVWAGHEFEVAVHGSGVPTVMNGAYFSCILQVPNGFTVRSAVTSTPGSFTRDDPAVLGLYTVEPGHYLASFTGYVSELTASLGVLLKAPPSTGGPHRFKVSLLSPGLVTDPPGVTQFAAITAPTHSKTLHVVADPVTHFRAGHAGLPVVTTFHPAVACGDLDRDGNDDLVLPEATGYRTWLSQPATPWLAGGVTGAPPAPLGRVALGDFNGDRVPDCADASGRLWLGDGQGNWTAGPTLPLAGWLYGVGVATGDFDRDGLDDVALGGVASATSLGIVHVFRNHGNGTFTPHNNGLPGPAGASSPSTELLLTDATGDGFADVIWTPYGTNVWAGDGQGNWTPGTGLPSRYDAAIAVGDLTGDGVPELVLSANTSSAGGLDVFTHVGGNQWVALPSTGLMAGPGPRGDVALLDFDRDGWLDIVAAAGEITLWRNLGGGTFAPVPSSGLPTVCYATHLAVGDFDGDTFPDVAATLAGTPTVWLNLGTGLSPYGAACSAPGFATPMLSANGLPQRGNAAFAVELRGGLPNGPGLVWLGLSKRFAHGLPVLPLSLAPFGAPGCAVLAEDLAVHFRVFDASGFASLPLPIPSDPTLARVTLFGQGATFAPGANALGWLFSGGLAVRIE